MGLFGKARGRSQSTSSVAPEPLLRDSDYDGSTESGSDDDDVVYLTHTKDGKPALGRKKPDTLLQGFGFDILGQTFGVPSRRDYERRARPLSAASQSSGLVAGPATPRRPRGNRQMYRYDNTESPLAHRKTSSRRSSSTPARPAMARYNSRDSSDLYQHAEYKRSISVPRPAAFNQHRIPPPPPPPPSVVGWHNHPMMNVGTAPIHMGYYGAAYRHPHSPSYPYNSSVIFQNTQNWVNPQQPMAAHHLNLLGAIPTQTMPIPVLPHRQQYSQPQPAQFPHTQAIPAARVANIPPPPPPPPQSWPQTHAMAISQGKPPRQATRQVNNAKNIVNKANQDESLGKDAQGSHGEPKHGEDVKQHLSKRIRHAHACAGCGKKRSARYQRAHPLKRGEIPPLNYCYKCLKDAADTDCETSDGDVAYNHPSKKDPADTTISWSSTDEGYGKVSGKYTYERARHSPRWLKKSTRFGPLSRLFSRRPAPKSSSPSPRSVSSAEESRSRASSLGSESDESDAIDSVRKAHIRPVRRSYERLDSKTFQRPAKTQAVPRNRDRYTNVDSRNKKYHSPLVPREEKNDKAGDMGEKLAASNNKPILGRSRIPRPRRHARVTDDDPSTPMDTGDLADILDHEGISPSFDANNALGVASMSPSRMEALVGRSNHMVSNEARAVNPSKMKNPAPSSKIANAENASGKIQRLDVQASANKPVMMPITKSADEPTDRIDRGFRPTELRTSYNHGPEISSEQAATHNPFPSSKNNTRRPSDKSKSTAKAVGESEAAFDWYEPLTPLDAPYSNDRHAPRVVSDSWADYQTDIEREAEEMAERDLAFAGKLFDSLSGSFGGSATSTFPVSSFVTASNISVVSYNSDSDVSDIDNAIPAIEEAGVREHSKGVKTNKATKRIEFSSEKERQEKSAKSKDPIEPSITGGMLVKHPDHQRNDLYGQRDDGDDDIDYLPSPIGSSLIGHTGHSADNLYRYSPVLRGMATTANDHCLRRMKRLPPS